MNGRRTSAPGSARSSLAIAARPRWPGGLRAQILAAATILATLLAGAFAATAHAAGEQNCDSKPTVRSPGSTTTTATTLRQWHNPNLAKITDFELCFEGYVSNFAGKSDIDGDGDRDRLRLPLFVAHRTEGAKSAPESRKRPTKWFSIDELVDKGIAPTDQSYVYSQSWRSSHPDWFERGHLAQKYLLERVSPEAAWYSHNVVNAVPQRGRFNKTVWLDLECRVGAWANRYDEVWTIAGPVFQTGSPKAWLKEKGRPAQPVAIPDSLFKIVLRKDDRGKWEALSFIMPQQDERYGLGAKRWNLLDWATSIDQIERITRQKFLTEVDANAPVRMARTTKLWAHDRADFDPPCVKFVGDE